MPIYEYRCQACGAQKEVLQRMNDAPLTDCAECGKKNTLSKMVTAAGFQLKGTGWYATDFRGGKPPATGTASGPADAAAAPAAAAPAASTDKPAAAATPAPASTGGSGTT